MKLLNSLTNTQFQLISKNFFISIIFLFNSDSSFCFSFSVFSFLSNSSLIKDCMNFSNISLFILSFNKDLFFWISKLLSNFFNLLLLYQV